MLQLPASQTRQRFLSGSNHASGPASASRLREGNTGAQTNLGPGEPTLVLGCFDIRYKHSFFVLLGCGWCIVLNSPFVARGRRAIFPSVCGAASSSPTARAIFP